VSDNVTFFPNMLQPTAALKAHAPIGVKFWENQETALKGLKEFGGRTHICRISRTHVASLYSRHCDCRRLCTAEAGETDLRATCSRLILDARIVGRIS
jgi:hypothetical protein